MDAGRPCSERAGKRLREFTCNSAELQVFGMELWSPASGDGGGTNRYLGCLVSVSSCNWLTLVRKQKAKSAANRRQH